MREPMRGLTVNKPWLKSYPEGVPVEIDLSAYSSILDIFEQSCEAYRQQTSDGFKWDAVDDRYTHVVEQLWPELEAAAGTALD